MLLGAGRARANHSGSSMTRESGAQPIGGRWWRIEPGEERLVVGRMQCGVFLHRRRCLVSGVSLDGGFLWSARHKAASQGLSSATLIA